MRKYLLIIAFSVSLLGIGLLASSGVLVHAASSDSSGIVAQPIAGQSVSQKLGTRAKASWPWYLARGSGFVAAAALIILMLSGIGLITGYTFRFLDPITAWASHRALGITFAVAVLVHMFSLLFDHFVPFNIWQILVPWLSNYKPVTLWGLHLGSLYVAFGVLAFYGVLLVIITSLLWVEKRPRIWALVHFLSYAIILFVFVHALYLGTDLMQGFFRWLWIGSGVGIAVATIYRLWRAKTV